MGKLGQADHLHTGMNASALEGSGNGSCPQYSTKQLGTHEMAQ